MKPPTATPFPDDENKGKFINFYGHFADKMPDVGENFRQTLKPTDFSSIAGISADVLANYPGPTASVDDELSRAANLHHTQVADRLREAVSWP